jgi:hypothetical protein
LCPDLPGRVGGLWSTANAVYVVVDDVCPPDAQGLPIGIPQPCQVPLDRTLYRNQGQGWTILHTATIETILPPGGAVLTGPPDGDGVVIGTADCNALWVSDAGEATCLWSDFSVLHAAGTGNQLYAATFDSELYRYEAGGWVLVPVDPPEAARNMGVSKSHIALQGPEEILRARHGEPFERIPLPAAETFEHGPWVAGESGSIILRASDGALYFRIPNREWERVAVNMPVPGAVLAFSVDRLFFIAYPGELGQYTVGLEMLVTQEDFAPPIQFTSLGGNHEHEVFLGANWEHDDDGCGTAYVFWLDHNLELHAF